ncbi:MAG: hypothetical protein HYX69_09200 [Planctomycetia bacterium]|nr:hypothetical protein [Planctomycetia bacterium]
MMSASLRAATIGTALALACATPAAAQWGNLRGKFVYDGDPPQPAALNIARRGVPANLVDESLLVDAKTGGVKNVVIFVRSKYVPVHPDLIEKAKADVVWNIRGSRLDPHVLPLVTSQTLVIQNNDPVACNVNVTPLGDVAFNPLIAAGNSFRWTFRRAQSIPQPVTDNIQPWIKGYVLPLGTPYVAISNDDGTFEIKNLPLGKLEFQVWHEKAGFVEVRDWAKGRFEREIKPGTHDMATIKLPPAIFNK